MARRTRNQYTPEQISMMWDCYQRGDSLHNIARMFDRFHGSIAGIIGRSGGIRPLERKRRASSLTHLEREEISRGIASGTSIRSIAMSIGRSPSTVSREIARNGWHSKYRASQAEIQALERAKRPKQCKLRQNKQLARSVASKLNRTGLHNK